MPVITSPSPAITAVIAASEPGAVTPSSSVSATALVPLTARSLVMCAETSSSSTRSPAVLRALLAVHLMVQMTARISAVALLALVLARGQSRLALQVVDCRAGATAGSRAGTTTNTTTGHLGRIGEATESIIVAPVLAGLLVSKSVVLSGKASRRPTERFRHPPVTAGSSTGELLRVLRGLSRPSTVVTRHAGTCRSFSCGRRVLLLLLLLLAKGSGICWRGRVLIIRRLGGHAVTLMGLAIHARLSCTTSEGTSVSTLAGTVSKLRVVCKKLIIISTDIVEHRPLAPVCMVTYLVHIWWIVGARIVRLAIWISAMLTTALPLRLLLLMEHVRALVRLALTRQGRIRGGAAAGLCISLGVAAKRLLLGLTSHMLRNLVCSGRPKGAGRPILLLRVLLRVLPIVGIIVVCLPLAVRAVVRRHVMRSRGEPPKMRRCLMLSWRWPLRD